MAETRKLSFIMLWKLNDWGLYNRRNEAILAELAGRDSVGRVLHVEHVTTRQLTRSVLNWLRADNRLLKQAYMQQIKKALSLRPVSIAKDNKYYIYSIVGCYNGRNSLLKLMSRCLMRLKYRAINSYSARSDNTVVLMAYPPLTYLPEAIKAIRHDLLISDIVDNDIERAVDADEKNHHIGIFRSVLPRSACIFATSPAMDGQYGVYANSRIEFLPNAVNAEDFVFFPGTAAVPVKQRKAVGYVGAINRSLDVDLLEHVVSHFTDVDFFLIGFCRPEQQSHIATLSRTYDNLHFLGERCHREVPAYLSSFDVLIAFKKNDCRTSGNNSLKMYEYLATGKPVVTTPVAPAEQFRDFVYIAHDKVQFAECLKKALEENDSLLSEKRKEAARENSWPKRVDVILDKISALT